MFSRRSEVTTELNAFSKALALARGDAALIDLTGGNPTAVGLPMLCGDRLHALAGSASATYAPSSLGAASARERVAKEFAWDPANTVLASSTSEIYGWLFSLLCDSGDTIAVPCPSYPLLEHLAHHSGVRTSSYALDGSSGWAVDRLDGIGPIRAALIVSPNNPTGSVLSDHDLNRLRELDVPLIIDEVFGAYPLDGLRASAHSAASQEGLCFTLGGLSKYAGLPQMKLAWVHVSGQKSRVDEALRRLAHLADAGLSLATPVQIALGALFEHGAEFREELGMRLRKNLASLRESVSGTACTLPRVDGGWYAPVRVPATRSDEEWALSLLERSVAVQPGYFYDFPDGCWLVLSLLAEPIVFSEGVRRLVEHVG